ncbi:MAG TPA: response regulator [Opitutaceae bacterium]|nr:response regulator [Opitutaceae bacterium]
MPAPLTILLVEDDSGSVLFFQNAAEEAGITNPIHVAEDGRKALDYLEGANEFADREKFPLPGLVVLDLRLPRATGFEVLKQMRANPDLPKINVIMLTASAAEEDIDKAYALGANAYLVKPLRLEELRSIVEAIKLFWLTHNHIPR